MNTLKIVKGNDFSIAIKVRAYTYTGEEIIDFDLSQCSGTINIYAHINKSKTTVYKSNYSVLNDNYLKISWPADKQYLGKYSLEVTGVYNGVDWRFYDEDVVFQIVNTNKEACIPKESIIYDGFYSVNSSNTHLISNLVNMHVDRIGEDNYVYAYDDVLKQYVKTDIYVKGDVGDIINNPDEEDLTQATVGGDNVLKFKDKEYNASTYSGMGRKYLRKNIVNNVNTLVQSMMPVATNDGESDPGRNTIYIIQYDYDLAGQTIKVPSDSVLLFVGGSINNGTVQCNNTIIEGNERGTAVYTGTYDSVAKLLSDRYTKSETYSKTELNSLITTPSQGYVTVTATDQTTDVTDILPSEGSADTIYRIANWDGSQYTTNTYSEYAWDGSGYVLLETKQTGIDNEPTAGSDNLVKSGGVNSLINNTFNEFAIISNKDPEYNKATHTFILPKSTNIQTRGKVITCDSDVIFSWSETNDSYSTHFLILNINTLEKRYIRANNNAVVLNENEALIALLRWGAGVLKGNFFSYYSNGEKITKLFSESIFADNVIVPTATKIGISFYCEGTDTKYTKLPLTIPSGSTVKIKLISLVTSDGDSRASFFGKTYKDDDNYVSLQAISIGEEKITNINVDIKYLKIATTSSLSSYKVLISFGGSEFESLNSDVSEIKDDVSEIKDNLAANESYDASDFTNGYFYLLTQGVGGTAPNNPVTSDDYACLRITVITGQTINLKTIGGKNARAYALTDVNRTILSVAQTKEDYSSEITLNVEQDGYLYVNTTAEFLPNVSVVISGGSKTRIDILEDDVESLKDKEEEVISYNSSALESGFFSFPMTTADPYAHGSNYASWKRLALHIYKGDELKISTVGGSSARAYGLANTEYIITSIADSNVTLNNQILNITEDGYIYLNCDINNVDNFSVVIHRKSQTNKSIVAKAFNPPVNLTKGNIRILDIGNSYTNNATKYLPDIINAAGVVSDYSLYKAIRGSGSFRTWVNCYNDADGNEYSITKVAGNTISEVTEGIGAANDGSLFRSALAAGWDIILIHQVSTYSNNFDMWEHPNSVSPASSLKEFIGILRKTNPNACIGFLMVHSYNANYTDNSEGSSLGRWQNIVKCTKEFTNKYGIDLIIPYGTAVQNLRASSLNDDNEFCSDGSHLAGGIGCYVASCCYYQSIFAPRTGISILGNTFRKTDLNETSPGVKNINDTNAALAQKAAFAACYDRYDVKNPDLIPDVSNFITASVGSLVDYYTKSETYTKAEVDALIAELRAELAANNNNE